MTLLQIEEICFILDLVYSDSTWKIFFCGNLSEVTNAKYWDSSKLLAIFIEYIESHLNSFFLLKQFCINIKVAYVHWRKIRKWE